MKKMALICVMLCFMMTTLNYAWAEGELWDCASCGKLGNLGNYCGRCGTEAPAAWDCTLCGHTGNTENYCVHCGKQKDEAMIPKETSGLHSATDLPADPVYAPNQSYGEYTVVVYAIEGIPGNVVCTVSRKGDHSEYYIECDLYGDHVNSLSSYDGKYFYTFASKSGLLGRISDAILKKAVDQNIWIRTEGTDDVTILPVTPISTPNSEYEEYTALPYTVAGIDTVLNCTVSRKSDEFFLECELFRDRLMCKAEKKEDSFVLVGSNSGVIEILAPAILQMANDQPLWLPINEKARPERKFIPYSEDMSIVGSVTITSDDGGTTMTLNPDGIYRFLFEAYSIEDLGTYTYENGVLTLTDKYGKTSVGEGDPIKLHYVYSDSDQLTGDYTFPVNAFGIQGNVADLPFAPIYPPNDRYNEFTTIMYTIEDIGADLYCTISRYADGSEYYLECNFYGDDQMTRTSYDGSEFVILEDKTGFMGGNTPDILRNAIEQNVWVPIRMQ